MSSIASGKRDGGAYILGTRAGRERSSSVGEDVKSTATQVRAEAADGAHQVGEETNDAGRRLKKELALAADGDV